MEFFSEQFFMEQASLIPILEMQEYSRVRDSSDGAKFDIFLSYNIKDEKVVRAIYYVLKKKGLNVYLDTIIDPSLKRTNCDKETAKIIHNRLINSKSLLYAQSPSAGESNWMPWELGVVDGHSHKCFIMPVTANAQQVTPRREYLSLYPYVKPDINNVMKIITEGEGSNQIKIDYVQYIRNLPY